MKLCKNCFLLILIIFGLSSCSQKITTEQFMQFAENIGANDYYKICNEIIGEAESSLFFNRDNDLIFKTETMVKKCFLETAEFEKIEKTLFNEFCLTEITKDYLIDGNKFDVYYVINETSITTDYKNFGFIAISEYDKCIYFYWFSNPDYDNLITNAEAFDEFYKSEFDWLD